MDERRRAERTALDGQLAVLPSNVNVRVLDISLAGVLLQTNQPLAIGTRGCLRLTLWGAPFAADLEVCRISPPAAASRDAAYRVGAVFTAVSPEHRQLIARFAGQ